MRNTKRRGTEKNVNKLWYTDERKKKMDKDNISLNYTNTNTNNSNAQKYIKNTASSGKNVVSHFVIDSIIENDQTKANMEVNCKAKISSSTVATSTSVEANGELSNNNETSNKNSGGLLFSFYGRKLKFNNKDNNKDKDNLNNNNIGIRTQYKSLTTKIKINENKKFFDQVHKNSNNKH